MRRVIPPLPREVAGIRAAMSNLRPDLRTQVMEQALMRGWMELFTPAELAHWFKSDQDYGVVNVVRMLTPEQRLPFEPLVEDLLKSSPQQSDLLKALRMMTLMRKEFRERMEREVLRKMKEPTHDSFVYTLWIESLAKEPETAATFRYAVAKTLANPKPGLIGYVLEAITPYGARLAGQKKDVLPLLKGADGETPLRAAVLLDAMDPKGAETTVEIATALPYVRESEVGALAALLVRRGDLPKGVRQALEEALFDPKTGKARPQVAAALAELGQTQNATERLLAQLGKEASADTVLALGALHPQGNAEVEARMTALRKHPDAEVAQAAIEHLARLPEQRRADPAMMAEFLMLGESISLAKAYTTAPRTEAALKSMGADAQAQQPAIEALLKSPVKAGTLKDAVRVLMAMHGIKNCVPRLLEMLDDEREEVVLAATTGLTAAHEDGAEVRPALIAILQQEQAAVPQNTLRLRGAATALWETGEREALNEAFLKKLFVTPDHHTTEAALLWGVPEGNWALMAWMVAMEMPLKAGNLTAFMHGSPAFEACGNSEEFLALLPWVLPFAPYISGGGEAGSEPTQEQLQKALAAMKKLTAPEIPGEELRTAVTASLNHLVNSMTSAQRDALTGEIESLRKQLAMGGEL